MSATVFVRNLPFDVTQEALERVFGEIGPVRKVDVIKDKGRRKADATTRGFAFVRFAMAADAAAAIERLHRSDFGGRPMQLGADLVIEIAKDKQTRQKKRAAAETDAAPAEAAAPEAAPAVPTPAPVEEVDQSTPVEPKKKRTKRKQSDAEKETAPEEAKANTKQETHKARHKQREEKVEVEAEDDAAADYASGTHEQSERNARRRMHREFLRQVEARKEADASAEQKSITIYGLSSEVTEKVLFKKMKKIAATTKIELKTEGKSNKPFAVVQLEHVRDVATAVQKLDQHVLKGATLTVAPLLDANRASEGRRLIVRNLSFQASDADLDKLFTKCGSLSEAHVVRLALEDPENAPEGAVGKSRGFGFVQFHDGADAKRAIDELNGFRFKGREMIVDFAVTKAKYLQQQQAVAESNHDEMEQPEEEDQAEDDEDEDVDMEDVEDEEMDEDAAEGSDDDEVDDEDEEEDEDEEDEHKRHITDDSEEQRARTLFLRNVSFQTTEDSLKEFFREFGKVDYARVVMDKDTGLSKGVGFVRFHDRDAAEAVLARSQPHTQAQMPKAKGKKQDNAFAMSALADGDALVLDGRMLIVTRSVSKVDATQLAEENSSQRKQKDKRNMYLAYEGTINVNKVSDEDLGIPRLDIDKRSRALREKKEKLKNPMYFVSPLRLSIRNIASYVDDKQLKKLAHDAAVSGIAQNKVQLKDVKTELLPAKSPLERVPVKVKMAKVVRDTENVKPGKEPRSRGYGFVEFVEHVHALAALRMLNNNPAYTSFAAGGAGSKAKQKRSQPVEDKDKSRLIVEFALENHGKLRLREKKQQDSLKKREEARLLEEAEGGSQAPTKKKSRGQRQREAKKARISGEEPEPPSTTAAAAQDAGRSQPQKKRKRQTQDQISAETRMPSNKAKAVKSAAKPLSRKERKRAKVDKQEQSFEALVRDYKKEIFGDRTASKRNVNGSSGADAQSERWFD